MALKELFSHNPNIIVNADLDGILSGIILVKHLNCRIVGFSNSEEKVWLADDHDDLYGHVYIDMFVADDRAICVDQHIVAINDEHQQKIKDSGTKYGPHIDQHRFFTKDDYKKKYPLGTVHYIIASLEKEGIPVKLPTLTDQINPSITVGDLILRADDAMHSTLIKYVKNCKDWWAWLKKESCDAQSICMLMDYLKSIKQQYERANNQENALNNKVNTIINNIAIYLRTNYLCSSDDGGFSNIVDREGNILTNFSDYINAMAKIMECSNISFPSHFITHSGKKSRVTWKKSFEDDFINNSSKDGHKIFSYAFVKMPDRGENWSYTVDMN